MVYSLAIVLWVSTNVSWYTLKQMRCGRVKIIYIFPKRVAIFWINGFANKVNVVSKSFIALLDTFIKKSDTSYTVLTMRCLSESFQPQYWELELSRGEICVENFNAPLQMVQVWTGYIQDSLLFDLPSTELPGDRHPRVLSIRWVKFCCAWSQ